MSEPHNESADRLDEIKRRRYQVAQSDIAWLVAEVVALRAGRDACAFALRGNYPEVLRDFDDMPAEIERRCVARNDDEADYEPFFAELQRRTAELVQAQAERDDWKHRYLAIETDSARSERLAAAAFSNGETP